MDTIAAVDILYHSYVVVTIAPVFCDAPDLFVSCLLFLPRPVSQVATILSHANYFAESAINVAARSRAGTLLRRPA